MFLAVVHHTSQFWPDVGRIGSVLAALFAGIGTFIGALTRRKVQFTEQKLQEVHVLVNGGLHAKIDELREVTDKLTAANTRADLAEEDAMAMREQLKEAGDG